MIYIRPERKEEREAINEIHKQAFGKSGERAVYLIEKLRNSPDFNPELSLAAIKNRQIVGHVLFSVVKIKTDKKEIPALSLTPMSVLPEFQKQKIGSLLVKEGLKACKRCGYDIVIVVGHSDYYPRFGFKQARKNGLEVHFKKTVPDNEFMFYEIKTGILRGEKGVVEFPACFDEAMAQKEASEAYINSGSKNDSKK